MSDEISIHQSLIKPMLLFGTPRTFAIFNATLLLASVVGLHTFILIPVCIIMHVVVAIMIKRDTDILKITVRHIRQKDYYRL